MYELISPGAAASMYSKTTDEVIEHIGKNCKIPEVKASLEQMTLMAPVMPPDPANDAGAGTLEVWKYKVKQYMYQTTALEGELKKAYGLFFGQCSDDVKAKLLATTDFQTDVASNQDVLKLLDRIRSIM